GEHVENDPAALLLLVVPRRALRRRLVALEYRLPKLAAHAQDAAEEPLVDQAPELADAGEEELVLHDAMLHPAAVGETQQVERFGRRGRQRLLAVDVLARDDGPPHVVGAEGGQRSVEVDRVRWIREAGVQVGRHALDAVRVGDCPELGLVPTDEDRDGKQPLTARQRYAALLSDGDDRADEMLVQSPAASDAVHDDPDASRGHPHLPRGARRAQHAAPLHRWGQAATE